MLICTNTCIWQGRERTSGSTAVLLTEAYWEGLENAATLAVALNLQSMAKAGPKRNFAKLWDLLPPLISGGHFSWRKQEDRKGLVVAPSPGMLHCGMLRPCTWAGTPTVAAGRITTVPGATMLGISHWWLPLHFVYVLLPGLGVSVREGVVVCATASPIEISGSIPLSS
jgi:hypothetical protein